MELSAAEREVARRAARELASALIRGAVQRAPADRVIGSGAPQREAHGLYSGAGGIALALARHARVAGDARAASLARDLFWAAMEGVERFTNPEMSFFHGCVGLAWAAGEIFEERDASTMIERLLPRTIDPESAWASRGAGYLDGASGAGVALLALAETHAQPRLLELALGALDHVLASGRAWGPGELVFHADAHEISPLLGFAHGTAGVAASLRVFARCFRSPELTRLIRRIHRYEARVLGSTGLDYMDQRRPSYDALDRRALEKALEQGNEEPFLRGLDADGSWCNGSVGLALSRLVDGRPRVARSDAFVGTAVRRAAEEAGAHLTLATLNLCHGYGGELELLRRSKRAPSRELRRRLHALLGDIAEGTLPIDRQAPSLGAMSGLASALIIVNELDAALRPASLLLPRVVTPTAQFLGARCRVALSARRCDERIRAVSHEECELNARLRSNALLAFVRRRQRLAAERWRCDAERFVARRVRVDRDVARAADGALLRPALGGVERHAASAVADTVLGHAQDAVLADDLVRRSARDFDAPPEARAKLNARLRECVDQLVERGLLLAVEDDAPAPPLLRRHVVCRPLPLEKPDP